jgi:hypothetical protein
MMTRPRQISLLQTTLHFSWTVAAPQIGQTIVDVFRAGTSAELGFRDGSRPEISVMLTFFYVAARLMANHFHLSFRAQSRNLSLFPGGAPSAIENRTCNQSCAFFPASNRAAFSISAIILG